MISIVLHPSFLFIFIFIKIAKLITTIPKIIIIHFMSHCDLLILLIYVQVHPGNLFSRFILIIIIAHNLIFNSVYIRLSSPLCLKYYY